MHKLTFLLLGLGFSLSVSAGSLPADPTRPAPSYSIQITTDTPEQVYQLQGLRIGSSERSAVINGKLVKVGQDVDGARVIAISRKGVSLLRGSEKQFISLAKRSGFSKVNR